MTKETRKHRQQRNHARVKRLLQAVNAVYQKGKAIRTSPRRSKDSDIRRGCALRMPRAA